MGSNLRDLTCFFKEKGGGTIPSIRSNNLDKFIQSLSLEAPIHPSYEELRTFHLYGKIGEEKKIFLGDLPIFTVKLKLQETNMCGYLEFNPTRVMKDYLRKYKILK